MAFVHRVAHLQRLYKTSIHHLHRHSYLNQYLKNIGNDGEHIIPTINLGTPCYCCSPRSYSTLALVWWTQRCWAVALAPMQAQSVVSWDGPSPTLLLGRLFRLGHQKVLYSLLLISFLGILQCFIKTLSASTLQYVFVSPVSASQPHPFLLPLQLPREKPLFKLNWARHLLH